MADRPVVEGTASVLRRIGSLRENFGSVLAEPALAKELERRMRQRFKDEEAPDGSKWTPLSLRAVEEKARRGSRTAGKALQRTGRLLSSFRAVQGSSAGLFAGNTGIGVRIGITDNTKPPGRNRLSPVQYGRLHNYGKGGQIKRRFIGLGTQDSVFVVEYVRQRLKSIAEV